MLRILNMQIPYKYKADVPAEKLFEDDICFIFEIEAPIYWWADFSGERTAFELPDITQNFEKRKNKIPISTMVKASVFLTYQQIVELCEDYVTGVFITQWPTEREYADLCETLLDIRGIRDLVQEDI